MQIGTWKNGGWQKCEMADYVYSVAMQANDYKMFHSVPDLPPHQTSTVFKLAMLVTY